MKYKFVDNDINMEGLTSKPGGCCFHPHQMFEFTLKDKLSEEHGRRSNILGVAGLSPMCRRGSDAFVNC